MTTVFELLFVFLGCFFFQAEDGIRDLVRSRGLGDVYKRQLTYEFKSLPEGGMAGTIFCADVGEIFISLSVLRLSLIHI